MWSQAAAAGVFHFSGYREAVTMWQSAANQMRENQAEGGDVI